MTIKKKTDLAADKILASRRSMLRNIGVGTAAVAASSLAAPAIVRAQTPIKWRLQTYSGAPCLQRA